MDQLPLGDLGDPKLLWATEVERRLLWQWLPVTQVIMCQGKQGAESRVETRVLNMRHYLPQTKELYGWSCDSSMAV